MSASFSKKIDNAYQTAVHVAYAVVLGLTFESVALVYSSPSEFLKKIVNLEPEIIAFTFAYLIFVTSWIGYVRSISKNGYKDNFRGTFRFLLDLLVVFFYYQTVLLASKISTTAYSDIFILFFAIFLVYVFWDKVKMSEYKKTSTKQEREFRFHRFGITITYFFASTVLLVLYITIPLVMAIYLVILEKIGLEESILNTINWQLQITESTDPIWNELFTVLAIVLVIMYRWRKWSSP